ncbi:MAG: hypothetical protein FDZ75_08055, partial [Actinobacteria bacterium]
MGISTKTALWREALGVLVALTASLAVPLVAAADYPPPVLGDTYTVQQSLRPSFVAGSEMMPMDFAPDMNGNVWTVETDWYMGLVTRIAKYNAGGQLVGAYAVNSMTNPTALAFGPDGLLYVADTGSGRIVIFDPSSGNQLGTLPSDGQPGPSQLSTITEAPDRFSSPSDLQFDANGTMFVTDPGYNRVTSFNALHEPLNQWGSLLASTGSGGFDGPTGLYVDANHVYVADQYNGRIQTFTHDGTYVSEIDKNRGGSLPLYRVQDVFVDGYGVTYVLDYPDGWGAGARFTRVGPSGEFLGEYFETPNGFLQWSTHLKVDEWGSVVINDRIFDGVNGAVRYYGLNAGAPDT